MSHFTEYPAVGGGDALHREERPVGVIADIHGRLSVLIHILCGDLPVLDELFHELRRADEAPLAVRDRNGVQVPDFTGGQPRGFVRCHACGHKA